MLLDPTNPEIPSIISRIFVNQSLNDVLKSEKMIEARSHLESRNIKTILNQDAFEKLRDEEEEKRKDEPSEQELMRREEEISLRLIEEKRMVSIFICL